MGKVKNWVKKKKRVEYYLLAFLIETSVAVLTYTRTYTFRNLDLVRLFKLLSF